MANQRLMKKVAPVVLSAVRKTENGVKTEEAE